MAAWPRRQAFWPQARNEEEAMLAEASVTIPTSRDRMRPRGRRPFGLRDAGAASSLRPFDRLRAVGGVERLLDDAFHCIACVAAP